MHLFKIKNANLSYLFLADLISNLGNFSMRVTLAVMIYELTGSKASLVASLLIEKLPILLFGNGFGQLAEKLNLKKVLIITDILGILLFIFLAFTYQAIDPLWSCLLFFVSYALRSLFDSAKSKAMVLLCSEKSELNRSVATMLEIAYLAMAISNFMAGYIIEWINISAVLIFNAITFLCSILFVYKIQLSTPCTSILSAIQQSFQFSHVFGLRSNLKIIRENKQLRPLAIMFGMRCLVFGFFNALLPVFILSHFKLTSVGLGIFFLCVCISAMLGVRLYKYFINAPKLLALSQKKIYFICLGLVEVTLMVLCFNGQSVTLFFVFGFLVSMPMLLIECRIDYVFLNESPAHAKSAIRGFQIFLKSTCFSLGIGLSLIMVDYVGAIIIPIIIAIGLTLSLMPVLWDVREQNS